MVVDEKVTTALAAIGLRPDDLEPHLLATVEDHVADPPGDPVQLVRGLLDAAVQGDWPDELSVQDAARAGAPYRPLRNAVSEVTNLASMGRVRDAAAHAKRSADEIVAEINGTAGRPADDRPVDEVVTDVPMST